MGGAGRGEGGGGKGGAWGGATGDGGGASGKGGCVGAGGGSGGGGGFGAGGGEHGRVYVKRTAGSLPLGMLLMRCEVFTVPLNGLALEGTGVNWYPHSTARLPSCEASAPGINRVSEVLLATYRTTL